MNQISQQSLLHLVIRVPKEQSAFTYFQLEANENLCFYSTLETSLRQSYRDIEIMGTLELEQEIRHVLETLAQTFPVQYLLDEVITDKYQS